jgi:electron transfer flavoprotein alpha subunit
MKAFLVTIGPKQNHPTVKYKHEGEEFLYILKGQIKVMIGENQNFLKKGETLHFDSTIPHKLRNLSDKEAKLLVAIYTP